MVFGFYFFFFASIHQTGEENSINWIFFISSLRGLESKCIGVARERGWRNEDDAWRGLGSEDRPERGWVGVFARSGLDIHVRTCDRNSPKHELANKHATEAKQKGLDNASRDTRPTTVQSPVPSPLSRGRSRGRSQRSKEPLFSGKNE
jgi:hypothetical protein